MESPEWRVWPLDLNAEMRTILLVDLLLHVEIDAGNDYVGDDVERAHAVKNVRIIERHLLGDLHKPPT
jgi:hypothetical protein